MSFCQINEYNDDDDDETCIYYSFEILSFAHQNKVVHLNLIDLTRELIRGENGRARWQELSTDIILRSGANGVMKTLSFDCSAEAQ